MDIIVIVAQIVGLIGTAFLVLSFQQKKRQNILYMMVFASIAFTVHFLLLNAITGAVMNIAGGVRAFVYSQKGKKWASSNFWPIFFLIVFGLVGILTADKSKSLWIFPLWIFPTISMLLTSISLWIENTRMVRFLTYPSSPCWLVYNSFYQSYSGLFTESLAMVSLTIAIIRYDILKREEKTAVEG